MTVDRVAGTAAASSRRATDEPGTRRARVATTPPPAQARERGAPRRRAAARGAAAARPPKRAVRADVGRGAVAPAGRQRFALRVRVGRVARQHLRVDGFGRRRGRAEIFARELFCRVLRRTTSQLRLVLTECPRRSRGAAATRLRGLSTPQPRRRRDSATRNLHVAAAAPPRLGYTEFKRRGRGRAATRLRGITTSTQVRPSSRSRSRRGPGPTHRRYPGASGAASRRSRRRPRRPRRRASDLSTKRRAAASGRATTTERAPERVAWRTPLSQLLLNWVDREDGIFASRQMSLTRAAFLDRSPRVQPPGEFLGLCTESPSLLPQKIAARA